MAAVPPESTAEIGSAVAACAEMGNSYRKWHDGDSEAPLLRSIQNANAGGRFAALFMCQNKGSKYSPWTEKAELQ